MNVFEFIPFVAAVVNFLLGIAVFSRGPKSAINQAYLIWAIAIAIWNSGVYFIFRATNPVDAFFWARFLQIGVIFLPIGLYHLCMLIARVKTGGVTSALYILGLVFVAADINNLFVSGVRDAGYAYYSVAGPTFWIFLVIYVSSVSRACWILYQKQKATSSLHRIRLRWLIIAIIILVTFGSNDILPIIGSNTYPFTNVRIYPLGSLSAIFYGLIVGYSVLQYQLLDIHITLSRFAAQLVRLAFISLLGFFLLLVVARLAPPGQFTPFAFFGSLGVMIVSAVLASFFFPQFFGKGSDSLERHILGDRFEYHARVQSFIQTMRLSTDSENLLEELDSLLANTVKVRSCQIILLNETTRSFNLHRSFPAWQNAQMPDLQIDSPVFEYFRQNRSAYLTCNSSYDTVFLAPFEQEARNQMKPLEPEFCFPLSSGNEVVGLMLLGPKVDQDVFTPHDLRLLVELTSNLGLVMNQVRLSHELQRAHEQDLLGRMSRGLAHDINNLLTPVQTLLQLFEESQLHQNTINELLPIALRNLTTVRTYINEALFFSRTAAPNGTPHSLTRAIGDAITTVKTASTNKGVLIIFPYQEEIIIEMDEVLIKRLICNLLSNAIDASQPSSTIEVELSPLPRTELSRDWHRIRIIDHGEGISPENLKRVSTPYFTTKDTGDGTRGFGLGLAIARKIVHLHGGNLSIASKERIGTTVQVDLPSRLTPNKIQNTTINGKAHSERVTT